MRLLFIAIAALTAGSAAAFAADMPTKAPVYVSAAAPSSWTGWTIGINGGGGFGGDDSTVTPSPDVAKLAKWIGATIPATTPSAMSGGEVGGQLGYNQQIGAFVIGAEADIQWSGIKGGGSSAIGGLPSWVNVTNSVDQSINWFGTVRGVLGWTPAPNWLVYGTGGLAYGEVEANSTWNAAVNYRRTTWTGSTSASSSAMNTGWAAGGGVKWAFLPNWVFGVEYLHVDLGSLSLPIMVGKYQAGTNDFTFASNIVRGTLGYKF